MRILYIMIISILLIIGIISVSSFSNKNKDLYETKQENEELTTEMVELQAKYDELLDVHNNPTYFDCEYTITLSYQDTLEFFSQDENYKYVAFGQYQGVNPVILTTELKNELIKNQFYELRIKGQETINDSFSNSIHEIIDIKLVDNNIENHVFETCKK